MRRIFENNNLHPVFLTSFLGFFKFYRSSFRHHQVSCERDILAKGLIQMSKARKSLPLKPQKYFGTGPYKDHPKIRPRMSLIEHLIGYSNTSNQLSQIMIYRGASDFASGGSWASYQIRKIAGCACAGNAGNVFPRCRFQKKPLVNDPHMHHGTCVTHVPWCMSGSLTCGDGKNVPGIPGACAPAILRIWQGAHGMQCLGLCVAVQSI